MQVKKSFEMDCSHRLENPKLNKEQNEEIFGKCYNYPSHGHTYKLEVTVSGPQSNGMVINFAELKKVVTELIIDKCDHHFLNEVEMFKGRITTAETMCEVFWKILDDYFTSAKPSIILLKIEVFETSTSSACLELK